MVDEAKIEKAVRLLLEGMGENVEREGLKDTPRRVALMYSEALAGMDENAGDHLSQALSPACPVP